MAKHTPEYRTDVLSCPLNAGKLNQLRDVVLTMRRIAKREASHQWTRFYHNRWEGFEQQAKGGWTRPWVKDNTLGTGLSQMVMSQVAASLKGLVLGLPGSTQTNRPRQIPNRDRK